MEDKLGTEPVRDPPSSATIEYGNGSQPQVVDLSAFTSSEMTKAGKVQANSNSECGEKHLLNGCHNNEEESDEKRQDQEECVTRSKANQSAAANDNDLVGALDTLRLNNDYADIPSKDYSGDHPPGSQTLEGANAEGGESIKTSVESAEEETAAAELQALDPDEGGDISYVGYESELQMPGIMKLITRDLSEPYSIYTYRYFIHNWPELCFLAMHGNDCVGAIVCKLDIHKKVIKRGYIAMLAVNSNYRRKGIGSSLVRKTIHAMIRNGCDEVVLEAEVTNTAALSLYENLGFVRDKRLFRYYLNGVDAFRLKLWLA